MGNEQEKDISINAAAVEVVDKHIPGTETNNKGEVDAFLSAHTATVTFDEAATKKLVRKIDMHLMPLMCVCYFLQFLDKSGITYAAVFGIRADLGLTGYQYSLLGSLFYLGYLCAEYPMAYLSQRLHVGRFIGCIIFIWGWVLMATAICQNFAHVAAVRFFLGVFECALTPSFIMITGMWYTRKEQPFRIGIWYSMNGFGSAFGALISYGTGQINHPTIQSWRFLFIIEGCATILWAFVIFFYFPATPMAAKWLTESEAVHAVERLRANRTGIINREWKWYQVREALNPMVDPTGWMLFWACVINEVVNGGVSIYKTLVIKSIGFNQFETALIGIPQGFSLVLWVSLCGYCASRFHDFRIWAMMLFLIPSFIGILLQVVLPSNNVVGRTIGVMLMSSFVGPLAVTMGLPAQNTGGYTKRSVTVGMAFIGYCVGNIIGPLAWVEGQTPTYISGYTTCLACTGAQWILFAALRIHWVRQNKIRAAMLAEREAAGTLDEHDEFADKTDREDLRFRYNL